MYAKISVIVTLMVSVAFCTKAQTTLSPAILSLEQCKSMAIENNLTMKNARYNTEASQLMSKYAFTKYFPDISAGGMAYTTDKGALQYTLEIPLKELGLGFLGFGDVFSHNFGFFKKGTAASLNFLQPLFMGGRIVYGNKLAHVGEEVARLEEDRTKDEIVLKVEEYYWKLATLNAKRNTLVEVIAMLDTLTDYVGSYVEAGVATYNDLLQVKLKRNQMASNMIDLDNGRRLVKMALSQCIGYGAHGEIDVAPSPDGKYLPEIPIEYYVNPDDALRNTSAYGLLNSAVKAADIEHKLAVGENLPVVAGGGGYFYEHLLGQNHTFGALYLTVAVPISDWWGGGYNIKKKKIEARIARNRLEDASQLLIINMNNAWNDIVSAREKISIALESIDQAKENLRLNKAYYEAGIVNLTDLLEAQALYKSSNDEYTESFGNFMIKTLQYRQATGQE